MHHEVYFLIIFLNSEIKNINHMKKWMIRYCKMNFFIPEVTDKISYEKFLQSCNNLDHIFKKIYW